MLFIIVCDKTVHMIMTWLVTIALLRAVKTYDLWVDFLLPDPRLEPLLEPGLLPWPLLFTLCLLELPFPLCPPWWPLVLCSWLPWAWATWASSLAWAWAFWVSTRSVARTKPEMGWRLLHCWSAGGVPSLSWLAWSLRNNTPLWTWCTASVLDSPTHISPNVPAAKLSHSINAVPDLVRKSNEIPFKRHRLKNAANWKVAKFGS